MPVRKVFSCGRNIIGKFPSVKMERMIAFESLIERDFIYLLDYEKKVERFEEQPLKIDYNYENKTLHYTPDFYLIEDGQNILVECKPNKLVNTEENQRKITAAREWCAQRGWRFRVVTECQIRSGFRLQNVKTLTQHARQNISPMLKENIYVLVNDYPGEMTIDSIARVISCASTAKITSSVLHMAFHHELWLAIDKEPISGATVISLSNKKGGGV